MNFQTAENGCQGLRIALVDYLIIYVMLFRM